MSDEKTTLVTVRVPEKTKENLKSHLGEATFKDLLQFTESLFAEGCIYCENGVLYLDQDDEPKRDVLMEEFRDECDRRSMDYELGMRKAINAIRRRDI